MSASRSARSGLAVTRRLAQPRASSYHNLQASSRRASSSTPQANSKDDTRFAPIAEQKQAGSQASRQKAKTDVSHIFGEASQADKGGSHRTQYNYDPFSEQPNREHYEFPLVNARMLAKRTRRPRGVRMLARDFIDDSLYNPHYGYFSRHAVLLPDDEQRGTRNELSTYKNEYEFTAAVESRYKAFEDQLKAQDEENDRKRRMAAGEPAEEPKPTKGRISRPMPGTRESLENAQLMGRLDRARERQSNKEAGEHDREVKAMAARQVWHTPTELFKPFYAHAIARYMLENMDSKKPLKIYEVGAGSGALSIDILDYVEKEHPDIYSRMHYNIIEISPRLAEQQRGLLARHIDAGRAQVTNKSVYDWEETDSSPCFFVALEVFDNLTHDVVRYTTDTLLPYQAIISIDASGDMHELWEPAHDTRIRRYFELVGHSLEGSTATPPAAPGYLGWTPAFLRRAMTRRLPLYPNLTPPQYIPTGSVALLDVLAEQFPRHRLVMSDFDALPDALEGHNAPVVQTRLNGTMVPVTSYQVHQGFFDIFFPTNFKELQRMHKALSGASDTKASASQILSHRAFLRQYADLSATTCRDGSNPMLTWYANASWFLS